MTIARCRLCKDAVYNYRHRLCLRHYNRAKERRRLTKGALSWDDLLNSPQLLNGERIKVLRVSYDKDPGQRSCLGCMNLAPSLPGLTCTKNQWGSIKYLSIDTAENGGLPNPLVGRARTCPYYSGKPRQPRVSKE